VLILRPCVLDEGSDHGSNQEGEQVTSDEGH
jgi:hypothetical protein